MQLKGNSSITVGANIEHDLNMIPAASLILPMKLTILFSAESCLTKDMFYSLFCPTVIPSLTV